MVGHLAFSDTMRRIFFGMAALLTASTAALADTTTLICHNDDRSDFGQFTLDLDEAAATVTINYPAGETPTTPPITYPARSIGPFPAQFDPKTIVFDWQDRDGRYDHDTLDRLTGVLLDYASYKAPWDQAAQRDRVMWHNTCHVGKAQF